ncbi:poly(ADP-ribose) glycohydrolase ARH3-like [Diaphorina citri]|uniref:ADP-ribosylhydrolase ARH3 n=1 Tax=Diaphorina citri TaxID=121845 RepID=A0A1S4EBU3_DIACI|nr:poly(ADP-ribose) glycohydrolase ARH3-like [Diaphorina citri]
MKRVEQNNDDDVEDTYVDKLDVIEKLLEDKNTKSRDVLKCLGNGIAAYESVPTALYVFLRAQQPIPDLKTDNPVTRAIQYAITLGGDTDTIATMAGAIAGAYHGRASIEDGLLSVVESVEYIENLAERLYDNVEASG